MRNLKTDEEFHQHLQNAVKDFHGQLKDKGFKMKLTKLVFAPQANDPVCPCGFEFIMDPVTGKITGKQCKRCPPSGN